PRVVGSRASRRELPGDRDELSRTAANGATRANGASGAVGRTHHSRRRFFCFACASRRHLSVTLSKHFRPQNSCPIAAISFHQVQPKVLPRFALPADPLNRHASSRLTNQRSTRRLRARFARGCPRASACVRTRITWSRSKR